MVIIGVMLPNVVQFNVQHKIAFNRTDLDTTAEA